MHTISMIFGQRRLFRKAVSICVCVLLMLVFTGCHGSMVGLFVHSAQRYDAFLQYPINTVWVSENPEMTVFEHATLGSLVTAGGERKNFEIHFDSKLFKLSGFCELITANGEDTDTQAEPLFTFTGQLTEDRWILRLDPQDAETLFGADTTEIVLYRKDAAQTGFFEQLCLTGLDSSFYVEFRERDGNGTFGGEICDQNGETVLFESKIHIPFWNDGRAGAWMALYRGDWDDGRFTFAQETGTDDNSDQQPENGELMSGTLLIENEQYVFIIDEEDVGTVFDPSVREIQLHNALE